jgi:hypothetical protein
MVIIDWVALAGMIAGIVATIIISLIVYKKQQTFGNNLQNLLRSTNVLAQQEEDRRDRHIRWFTRNSLNVLNETRRRFVELRQSLIDFRASQSEETLRIFQTRGRTLLEQLDHRTIPFISDEIRNAVGYIGNPWLTNHFLDELLLIRRPSVLISESNLFVGMNDDNVLRDLNELIDDSIQRIDNYIEIIQGEQG